jgi:hypothetical protein
MCATPNHSIERSPKSCAFGSALRAPAPPHFHVRAPMISKLALSVLTFFVWAPVNAANGKWEVLQEASNGDLYGHTTIKAVLLEDQAHPLKSDVYVGNIGAPANNRSRKLVVEAVADMQTGKSKKWEFFMPSSTLPGDDCSVNEISNLSIKGEYLSVSINYQFACGAGSAVDVTHTISVSEKSMNYDYLQLRSASRDGIGVLQLDFRKGKIADGFNRPEDVKPRASKKSSFKPYTVKIDPLTFIRCPYPLHGKDMPNCASRSTLYASP